MEADAPLCWGTKVTRVAKVARVARMARVARVARGGFRLKAFG